MIAKCIFVLAVVAQIKASGCGLPSIVGGSSPVLMPSGFGDSSSRPFNRNLIGSGKYPIALRNCEPTPDQQIPVTTSSVTTRVQERPTIRLPANIPPPKTICHSCTCYKTILRPRVHHEIINVPSVQRYVETVHKPVVENIQYEALPVNCGCSSGSGMQLFQLGVNPSSSGSVDFFSLRSGSSQPLELPSVQFQPVPQSFGDCSC